MNEGYKEFIDKVRWNIIQRLGVDEKDVYFEAKGGVFTEKGDRIFVVWNESTETRDVMGIFVEKLYKVYQEKNNLEEIVDDIIREIEWAKENGFAEKSRRLDDYKKVKNELFIRPLNIKANRIELEDAVYRPVGDIALVLYMLLGIDEKGIDSIKVRKEYVDKWKMDGEKVMDAALLNTYFLTPPRLYDKFRLLLEPEYRGENFMDLLGEHELDKSWEGNFISTTERVYGAVAVFLPGVAERLGQLLGTDYYLLFISEDLVIVCNENTVSVDGMKRMLKGLVEEVFESGKRSGYLTTKVYHYSRATKAFTWEQPEAL